MRVLLTGSQGQLGSWVRDAAPGGARLAPLDLRHGDPVDIRTPRAAAMAREADVVLHLAALIDVAASTADPAETMSVNVEGTRNLVAAAPRGSRFVLVSSAAVYGDAGQEAISEEVLPRPISPYGRSKLEAEAVVRDIATDRGIDWVIVRPFNLYSSRQDPRSPYAGVITAFIRAAYAGKPFRIDGDGRQTRDFIHASDVAAFLWVSAQAPAAVGQTFNVATGASITILELAAAVQRACGVAVPLQPAPPRPGDIRFSHADVRRARALGWSHRISLDEGLRETADGMRPRVGQL